ncbi:membrane protein [Sphaerisporangium melleum]|uniref:Membrane protein n=1 Tax=Sphaerisporangium melleum TaxID=321316 RepID=A0A917R5I0_9ACTN|nr:FUSC family protein [Sphaerisporangium melleum]GGK89581.1 membrane protein [Sphaerisporangium melleum]GII72520.1 membrane protein [Sphaerisporangium melleum]
MPSLFQHSADRLAGAAPGWLVETVRPAPARPDPVAMARVAASITGPLLAALAAGTITAGLLPAMGAMAAALADRGGSYRARAVRVAGIAAGGAAGYVAGHAARGLGWWTVAVIVAVSVVSALVSATGAAGSLGGLQLVVMTVLGMGVSFTERPLTGAAAYAAGAAWALLLSVAGRPLRPRAAEESAVAAAYGMLCALVGRWESGRAEAVAAFDAALKNAYDTIMSARSAAPGPDAGRTRLVALLNQAIAVRNALMSLGEEGLDPGPEVAEAVGAIAGVLAGGGLPARPPLPAGSPALRAVCTAVGEALDLATGNRMPEPQAFQRPGLRARAAQAWERMRFGHLARVHTVRLALCMGVAAAFSELHWTQRSYWVMLTVALVLKPDFGSVFARAVQRGLGAVAGAFLGSLVLYAVPYGPAILIPLAVFAALLPYGQQRNWGLMSTFQVPVVVLLVDLLTGAGPRLAEIRLIDTLIGCAIVLVFGYLPWPASWEAPVGPPFADAVTATARYLRGAFGAGPPSTTAHRAAFDALADLRTVFQRALTEPPVVSRRVTTWLPAMTALEQVAEATAATAARARHGAPAPTGEAVEEVAVALEDIAGHVRAGEPVCGRDVRPAHGALEPVAGAVRNLRDTLAARC